VKAFFFLDFRELLVTNGNT